MLGVHQGNWEWMIQAISNRASCPVDGVYKPLHGETGDKIFYHTRSRFGMRLVPFDDAMRRVLKGRKELRIFSMMADQAPISREKRYWRSFMNRPAPFYYGPQLIAEATQYPVVYAKVHRSSKGHYRVTFKTIATPPNERNSVNVLENYIQTIEKSIKEQPESFLWSNKKWRSPKSGELDRQVEELELKAQKRADAVAKAKQLNN
jgi:KDO2-lipid IV(A) lauroyltransferase